MNFNSLKILMFIYFLNVCMLVLYSVTLFQNKKSKSKSKNSEVLFLRTFMIVIVLICLNLYGIYRANFINNLDLKTLCRKSMKLSLKTN